MTYRLGEKDAMEYIKQRFGEEISHGSYKRRRNAVNSDKSINTWLHYFTRVGFVKHHKEIIDNVKLLLADSNRRLLVEQQKDQRNEFLIMRMKEDIRQSLILLSELGMGTPIIAEIKAKLAKKEEGASSPQGLRQDDAQVAP
jgi:hypothetical protein